MLEQALDYAPLVASIFAAFIAFWFLDKIPALKGLRVIILNGATVFFMAVPAMMEFLTTVNWEDYLPATHARWLVVALAVLNIYFRIYKTTTPFGKSPEPPVP